MRKIFYRNIFSVLVIAALIGMGFILNNPHVGADEKNSYTVIVLDTHLSMDADVKIQFKEAAIEFASRLTNKNDNNYIAVINYLGSTEVLCNFTNNLEDVTTAINKHDESYGYYKNMHIGLEKAKDLLDTYNIPTGSAKNIILLTSGISNIGPSSETGKYSIMDSADYEYANKIYELAEEIKTDTNIYTIGFYSPTDYPNYNPFFIRKLLDDISSSKEHYYDLMNSPENRFKPIFNDIANNIVKMHIIFIHGIAGSEMERENGTKLWLVPLDHWKPTIEKMELDEYGNSVNDVRAVTSGYGTANTGKKIIQSLENEYGKDNVHYFAYDWRLDNGINAVKLNEFIDELGVGQVDIVAHSMGGIVTSRFIADGNKDKIRKLVTLGTPYLGSPKTPYVFATGRLIELTPFDIVNIGIAHRGIKRIAPHMTSAYQLLPYNNPKPYIGVKNSTKDDLPVTLMNDAHYYIKEVLPMEGTDGNPISSTVKGNFLNKSIPFMESIYPNGDAAIKSVDYHVIVGDNKQTISTTIFDLKGKAEDLTFTNGDGTVPLWSATINDTIPETRLSSFDETHMGLVSNKDVLAKVIDILNDKSQGSYKPLRLGFYFKLRIACPVDVKVTHNGQILSSSEDDYNGETDFGGLYIVGENDEIKILTLSADNIYDVNLIGTGIGTMDYSVEYYDSSDNLIEETLFSAVNITDDTRITTKINDGKQITLLVDEDNNGSIDNIIYPDKDTHTLTLTAGLGGSISAGTSGDYESDSKINITAVPITGYSFKKWSSSNGGSFVNENSSNTIFTMPDNSTTVTAQFEYIGTSNSGNSGGNGNETNNNSGSGANNNTGNGTNDNTRNGNNNYYSGKIAESVTSFIYNTPSINETISDDKQTSIIESEQIKNPFNDVFDYDWFFEDVLYAYHNKLMLGTSENPMLFSPNTPLTRGMIVTILYRYIGEPSVKGINNPFDDISADAWYADTVIWAASSGIVSGYGDGQFGADANITRQDLAVILNNYIKYEKINFSTVREYNYFNDNNDIADYAKNSVEHFYKYGFINGKPDNLFDPTGQATRAEVSAILHRFIESAKKY